MTYPEHVQWARERAHEYVDKGLGALAIASMVSDLTKHRESLPAASVCMLTALAFDDNDPDQVRRWIDGCLPGVPVVPRKAVTHG